MRGATGKRYPQTVTNVAALLVCGQREALSTVRVSAAAAGRGGLGRRSGCRRIDGGFFGRLLDVAVFVGQRVVVVAVQRAEVLADEDLDQLGVVHLAGGLAEDRFALFQRKRLLVR